MWAVIVIIILVGLILLALEIMVIPGVGITGILGFLLMTEGVWLAYSREGTTAGNITLIITVLLSASGMAVMLRSKTWKNAQLKISVSGKVRTLDGMNLKVGMHGKTTTRCAPIGKAVFGNNHVEVDAGTDYLKTGTPVEIVRIYRNKIFIKYITT